MAANIQGQEGNLYYLIKSSVGRLAPNANTSGAQVEGIARGKANAAANRTPAPHDAGKAGGAAMNVTAGLNEAIYGTLGLPVDATRGLMNLCIRGANYLTGGKAREGLRKAIVDYIAKRFVGNTESGTSGLGTIKSDGFQTFARQKASALPAAGFSADEIGTMQRVADDLQRANRSIASVKLPGGSSTVQDALAAGRQGAPPTLLSRLLSNIPAAVGGAGGFILGGGPVSAIAGAAGARTLADMRRAGIESVEDLVADALLNPSRARLLLASPSRRTEAATWHLLGRYYRRAAAIGGAEGLADDGERRTGTGG